jgi:CheY-like chemotaxis protein
VLIGDPFRLNQIMINLLSNALKFTHYGQVMLSARLVKKLNREVRVEISVRDTGIGIKAEKLQRIFERFSQADESITRKFGGTGLGLTIVKQLVEMQRGKIAVASRENEGATFTVVLPFRLGSAADLNKDKADGTPGFTKGQRGTIRVLLVEDNDINRLYARTILKNWGCQVETAENGQVALDMARHHEFDVILMDIQMPVLDGLEATKAIRLLPAGKNPAIVALTANTSAADQQVFLKAGMDASLGKPFTPEELDRVLRRFAKQKTIPVADSRSLNLDRIRKVSTNPVFLKEMIHTFLDTLPPILESIKRHTAASEYDLLAKAVHKVKPSLSLMGADGVRNTAMRIEERAKERKEVESLGLLTAEFLAEMEKLVEMLEAELRKS